VQTINSKNIITTILQAETQSDYDLIDKTLRDNPKLLTHDVRRILEGYELKRDVLGLKNSETSTK
jgi:hypothetical protein